jgi:hypothetical protein
LDFPQNHINDGHGEERIGYLRVRFEELGRSSHTYLVKPLEAVKVAEQQSEVEFFEECDSCGNYRDIVFRGDLHLEVSRRIERGIYRTNIKFACKRNKNHLMANLFELAMFLPDFY